MQFIFKATSELVLEHKEGDAQSIVKEVNFWLDMSGNLDKKRYIDKDLPTVEGCKAISSALVAGLVSNIHYAEMHKMWSKEEHLQWIMKHIEEGLSKPAEARRSNFKL